MNAHLIIKSNFLVIKEADSHEVFSFLCSLFRIKFKSIFPLKCSGSLENIEFVSAYIY